jgi:hypothetical protein
VSETLYASHPLIKATRQYWAAMKHGEVRYGENTLPYLNIRVSQPSLSRALRLMHALLTALESRQFAVGATCDGKTTVAILGETLELSLRERLKQVVHEPTAKELADLKRWSWSKPPKFDQIYSGIFELNIDNTWDTRHTWKDGKHQRLELLLNDVIEGLVGAALLAKQRQAEREKERLAEEERARRRQEVEARRRAEEDKIKQWDEWMTAWKRTEDVRAFAAAIRQELAPIEPGSKVDEWLNWAEAYAKGIDPLRRDAGSDK